MRDIESWYFRTQKGNFFQRPSPFCKEKHVESVKQLRWDGREFYIVSHTLPRPAVRKNWEKNDGRDLKISVMNCTATQVCWEVEFIRETLPEEKPIEKQNGRGPLVPPNHYGRWAWDVPAPNPKYKFGPGIGI